QPDRQCGRDRGDHDGGLSRHQPRHLARDEHLQRAHGAGGALTMAGAQAGSVAGGLAYVGGEPAAALPPPFASTGLLGWCRANLFGTPFNAVLTVLTLLLLAWAVPPLVRFLLVDAAWTGADREACLATATHPNAGACWAFVREHLAYFT